ncbi:hypothetical protein BS47DRAFT_1354014 [Hydnum rufescens UP504]|uniref:Uncharacterized protein n=1 Tax=Hydnum rufescens UP504 TaxID=1448309 RepID=A0A9P6DNM4_9AGAM|nr:hypothetical protein BS47DRAFT_1354014 [Hydnum rufescens UP504]
MRTTKRSLLSRKIFHVVRLAQLPTRNSQPHSFPPICGTACWPKSRVVMGTTILRQYPFRHQGAIGAALVFAESNRHAHISSPHGSRDKLLCGTMGSGSLAAMAVFESRYSIAGRPPRQFLSLTSTRPARRISYVYT